MHEMIYSRDLYNVCKKKIHAAPGVLYVVVLCVTLFASVL